MCPSPERIGLPTVGPSVPFPALVMITGKELTWIVASYLIGCFTVGYYWVRWRTGDDVRLFGSGNVGARNVGRRLGKISFVVTLLLDAAKGALAVFVARHFQFSDNAIIASMAAALIGHNWPVQLRFQGGKGVAVSVGALLAYEPILLAVVAAICLPVWALVRSFTLSGLIAFALAPLVVFLRNDPVMNVVALSVLAILLLIGHRKNLREEMTRIFPHRAAKDSARPLDKGAGS